MGRSKQSQPKRRRLENDNHPIINKVAGDDNKKEPLHSKQQQDEQQLKAIEALKQLPSWQIEQAAEEVFAQEVIKWPLLLTSQQQQQEDSTTGIVSSLEETTTVQQQQQHDFVTDGGFVDGLGKCVLSESALATFQILHDFIKENVFDASSWSGDPNDSRRRAYGFINEKSQQQVDLSQPDAHHPQEERNRNGRASIVLLPPTNNNNDSTNTHDSSSSYYTKEMMDELKEAITELRHQFSNAALPSPRYVSCEEFIAAQPNLHGPRFLLPAHWDHPTKDGFGIIIVTIAMKGSGTIFLSSYDDKHHGRIEINPGEAYMLSGKARNACTHGVLAHTSGRESLNLRFGLHGRDPNSDPKPDEVIQYWRN